MGKMPYKKFLELFENGRNVDETVFYFKSDKNETEHYLGYLPEGPLPETPYWAGYCDLKDGFECASAIELFQAKIFDRASLEERWEDVCIICIGGIPFEEWSLQYIE